MWGNFMTPEVQAAIQKYQQSAAPASQPAADDIYSSFSAENVTAKDAKKGLIASVVDVPLKPLGLVDMDYPFFKATISVSNGQAKIHQIDVLDKGKEADAKAIGEWAVQRVNDFLAANPGANISGTFGIGGASGRHKGKESGKLGKGLFVGKSATFNKGAEYTGLNTVQDLAKSLDQFLIGSVEGKHGFSNVRPPESGEITLPTWTDTNIQVGTRLGKVDNTSAIARTISGIAIAAAATAGVGALANAGTAASTAGTTGAATGATGSMAAGATAAGYSQATLAPWLAAGGGTLPAAGAAGSIATGSTAAGSGIINKAIQTVGTQAVNRLMSPSQTDVLAEERRLLEQSEAARKSQVAANTNVGNTSLGIRPSGKPLTDRWGNPVYNQSGGIIKRAMAA